MKYILVILWGLLGLAGSTQAQLKSDSIQRAMELAWKDLALAPCLPTSVLAVTADGATATSQHLSPFSIHPQGEDGRVKFVVEAPHIQIHSLRLRDSHRRLLWEDSWSETGLAPLEFSIFLFPKAPYQFEIETNAGTWVYEWQRP